MARDRPGNRGVPLGPVVGYDPRREEATVRLSGEVVPRSGDGLAFCTGDPDQDVGAVVRGTLPLRNGTVRVGVPAPVGRDMKVYLTKSADLEERAGKIMDRPLPQLPIDVVVTWEDGTPCFLGTPVGKQLQVTYRADVQMEPARSRPLAPEGIAEQFTRTGGTPFVIRRLDLRYPGGLFAPPGVLNRIRRAFLERVEEAVVAAHRPESDAVLAARKRAGAVIAGMVPAKQVVRRLPPVSVYTDTLEGVGAALRGGARTVYFAPIEARDPALLEEAAALCRVGGADRVWKRPAITRRAFLDVAVPLLPSLYDAGVRGAMVSGIGAACAVREAEPWMHLYGAAGMNVWNHRTTRELAPLFLRCTSSPELPAADLARLAELTGDSPALEVLVQGNTEAMVTEDRLAEIPGDQFVGLQDRHNRIFPLRSDSESRVYIANAVETCLIDHLPRIIGMGIDAVAIDARGRGPLYTGEMVRLYRAGVEAAGRGDRDALNGLKEEVKERALGGITGGHFARGLTG